MKFSHSIQFNAVPEWTSHYINYSNLKKLCVLGSIRIPDQNTDGLDRIYTCEKAARRPTPAARDAEASPLLDSGTEDTDTTFRRALDVELERICSFYETKELEIFEETYDLLKDEHEYVAEVEELERVESNSSKPSDDRMRQSSVLQSIGHRLPRGARRMSASLGTLGTLDDQSSDSDADETTTLNRAFSKRGSVADVQATRNRRQSVVQDDLGDEPLLLYESGINLKKRTISLYVSLCELKSFIQLNKTGFTKALKKYDKTLDRTLKSQYIKETVEPTYPFRKTTMQKVEENISKVEQTYADIVTKGDIGLAKRELRLHLREHVVWERNTVWREMIGIERKAQAANLGVRRTLLGGETDPSKAQRQGDEPNKEEFRTIQTPLGRYSCPSWLFSSTFFMLVAILAVFVVLLNIPIALKPEQQNCLALLVFVSLLWATEVIPLFVTSLLIPFLAVVLRVARSDNKPNRRLEADQAAKYIFAAMWTPVIMLLLGGFTIAAALSKYDIAKRMATFVLSRAGTRPRTVLITNMFVAMIASMWISNVAAPVLCYSIIQPLLRNLPYDSNFTKALILGIALASNIGGAASPIASPQNIIALENMQPDPDWLTWFFIALPVCIISILLIWVLLLVTFQPGKGTNIVPIKPVKDPFTGVQWFISLVTIATIVLWCVSHKLDGIFGDMGVIAIIPMVLFFGSGVLTKEDFNNFLWTIIILAAGGLSLGKAVASSGLLHTIAEQITKEVHTLSLYSVLVVFACLILVVATFISHTVAALIILPLVRQVGNNMDQPHPNLLVMGSALMCSAAMGLPTSGFPNMTAIMMEDSQTGKRYLRVRHFLSRGIPSSFLTMFVIITVGYGLMLVVGF